MSRLEIKVDGQDVAADKMLRMATLTLKLLRSIEIEHAKAAGRSPRKHRVRWRVDIQSGFNFGLIAIRGELPEGQKSDALTQETSQAIMREAITRQASSPGAQGPGT